MIQVDVIFLYSKLDFTLYYQSHIYHHRDIGLYDKCIAKDTTNCSKLLP